MAKFIKISGFTIGDAVKILSEYFDEEKALLIAITETTRAFAHAEQIQGEQSKKDFPDVKVVKIWHTNNDSEVCEICGSLNEKEVDINRPFAEDIFIPPAHEGCRCWISTRTRI